MRHLRCVRRGCGRILLGTKEKVEAQRVRELQLSGPLKVYPAFTIRAARVVVDRGGRPYAAASSFGEHVAGRAAVWTTTTRGFKCREQTAGDPRQLLQRARPAAAGLRGRAGLHAAPTTYQRGRLSSYGEHERRPKTSQEAVHRRRPLRKLFRRTQMLEKGQRTRLSPPMSDTPATRPFGPSSEPMHHAARIRPILGGSLASGPR